MAHSLRYSGIVYGVYHAQDGSLGDVCVLDIGMVNGEKHVENFSFGRGGQLDYFAIDVREKVNELQLQYERTGIASSTASNDAQNRLTLYNQQLTINIFGEVAKSVVVTGDMYNVEYM